MKALGTILLGVFLAAITAYKLLEARAAESEGMASLWFAGLVISGLITLAGLVMNHRDHTRK